MAVIEEGQQFSRPLQQTLKADHTKMISRCAVCRRIERSKERPRYEPPTVQPPPELIAAPESRRFFHDRRYHLPHQQSQAPRRRQRIHPPRNYYNQ